MGEGRLASAGLTVGMQQWSMFTVHIGCEAGGLLLRCTHATTDAASTRRPPATWPAAVDELKKKQ